MPRSTKFAETLLDWVEGRIGNALLQPLWLGGAPGPSGGSGGRQFDGQLTQGEVTFDTTEAASPCYPIGGKSLVDNLNRMRKWAEAAKWFYVETLASGLKVSVLEGLWYPSGVMLGVFAGADSPTFTLPTINQRIDTLYLDINNDLKIQQGTESANPTITIPTAQYTLPLWAIRLTPTSENIRWSGCSGWWDGDGYIAKDLRPFFNLGGGGGASVFTALSDTPVNFTGAGNKVVTVHDNENELIFENRAENFLDLTDTPTTYSGESNKYLRVKSTEDQIEFTTSGAEDHNHTSDPGDGGELSGAEVDTYMDFNEGFAPSDPAIGVLRVYALTSDHKMYQRRSTGAALSLAEAGGGGGVTGSGTAAYIPRWTSTTALGNSSIYEPGAGTNIEFEKNLRLKSDAIVQAHAATDDTLHLRGNGTGGVFINYSDGTDFRVYDNTTLAFIVTGTPRVGIKILSPDRSFHINESDAGTNTTVYATRLTHETSGTAAARFGIGEEHELEDAAGNLQVASALETIWAVPTSGSEIPLRRWDTRPHGYDATVFRGYCGHVSIRSVGGTAITIIPDGGNADVTHIVTVTYAVYSNGDAGSSGGCTTCANNSSVALYSNGGETLTFAVAADGHATLQRTAGADTFVVSLFLVWFYQSGE